MAQLWARAPDHYQIEIWVVHTAFGKKLASNRVSKLETHFGSNSTANPEMPPSISSTQILAGAAQPFRREGKEEKLRALVCTAGVAHPRCRLCLLEQPSRPPTGVVLACPRLGVRCLEPYARPDRGSFASGEICSFIDRFSLDCFSLSIDEFSLSSNDRFSI